MIIGLVGEKLAGKDTAAEYLVKKYGGGHLRFSNVLDDILRILNLPLSRRNEIDLGLGLRKIFGEHILVNAVIEKVKGINNQLVVVNGIRMDEDVFIKSLLGSKLVYITAPVELRFKRYQSRHEKPDDALMNFEQFKLQEQELTEVGIPDLGTKADFRIDNTGSVEELYKKIDEIINQLK